jgi:hypothetical protein
VFAGDLEAHVFGDLLGARTVLDDEMNEAPGLAGPDIAGHPFEVQPGLGQCFQEAGQGSGSIR